MESRKKKQKISCSPVSLCLQTHATKLLKMVKFDIALLVVEKDSDLLATVLPILVSVA